MYCAYEKVGQQTVQAIPSLQVVSRYRAPLMTISLCRCHCRRRRRRCRCRRHGHRRCHMRDVRFARSS